MRCPFCGESGSRVVDSRTIQERNAIRRRRECEQCKRRFTTYERREEFPLMVVKKDGRREMFDRNKVLGGIIKALEKRPVSGEQVEHMVDEIERKLYSFGQREVASQQIGELVMEALRDTDEVAYVRFASVYRQFKDINRFLEELEHLLEDRKA
ncbi:MAG: transcriptional regulator NrdR [Limnochordia bacterium]|nr:transcriptional regulator NrdR [Limnochordia bacterium]MDD4518832.1 transcriptional regulator NrdR [Limnochordia bacterium]